MIVEAVVFLIVVAGIAVLGIRIGMLVAPRIGRLADDADKESDGDD